MRPRCVFCEIVLGIEDAEILQKTDSALIIKPLNPVTEGHALVIPYMHVSNWVALPAVSGETMAVAARYARRFSSSNLIASDGEDATQTVFHLHLHVVPRVAGDGLLLPWSNQGEGDAQ